MKSAAICQDERRRTLTRERGLNGLDYLEVSPSSDELFVYLLGKFPCDTAGVPLPVSRANFRIAGGRRVPEVKVLDARVRLAGKQDRDNVIAIRVERPNDLSNYTLQLQRNPRGEDEDLLGHFDPRFTALEFSFGVDCPSDLDCAQAPVCPPEPLAEPEIDYLARDYAGFRKLILDRLTLVAPDWKVRYAPDISMALIELLAYLGDRLSYYQDAVATESYLGTARRRISLRRHARLVDYLMHEGCNARAFVCIETSRDLGPFDPRKMLFLTAGVEGTLHEPRVLSADDVRDHLRERIVFMPLLEPEKWELDATDVQDWEEAHRRMAEYAKAAPAARVESEAQERKLPVLARIWSRLGDALQSQLHDGGDPYDPVWQQTWLADLNRVLRDRGFARATAAMSEREVIEINRRQIEEALGEAIAKRGSIVFREAHSRLRFYTWGDVDCCLPKGAKSATLWDEYSPEDAAEKPTATADEYPAADAVYPASAAKRQRPKYEQRPPPPAASKPAPRKRKLRLRVGDILIFEEVIGPKTGLPADADPARRHAVRLTRVTPLEDPVILATGASPKDESACLPQPVVEIEWAEEDALPFALCISVRGPADARGRPCRLLEDVSIARGNVLLVDHGREVDPEEEVGVVECERLALGCRCEGTVADPITKPRPFSPELAEAEITSAGKLARGLPAARMLRQDPRRAVPAIELTSIPAAADGQNALFSWRDLADVRGLGRRLADKIKAGSTADLAARQLFGRLPESLREAVRTLSENKDGQAVISDADAKGLAEALAQLLARWEPRRDLVGSAEEDRHFVVEVDDQRRAHLRFGFDGLGRTPAAGEAFRTKYRVGNGLAGNVGADKITHMVLLGESVRGIDLNVRNPLPAYGGTAPESAEEVRRNAPYAFRREIGRAITPEDYRAIAERHSKVQRAAAELRWRNSRYLARVAIDPLGSEVAPRALLSEIHRELERCRRIGHDVEVISAVLVPLRITLHVCVRQNFQPGHVKQALLEMFSNRLRSDGKPGFFHPDSLTFGEAIRLSKIVAVAQAVTGVANVRVTELRRYFSPAANELREGLLPIGHLEIARCNNDPSFPENGTLTIELGNAS